MSRIGKLPIHFPEKVEVKVSGNVVTAKGPAGQLEQKLNPDIKVKVDGSLILVERPSDQKRHKALHGLSRALLANMVEGVSKGYRTDQEVVGVGYRAVAKGQQLHLTLGLSHEIIFELPKEVKLETTAEKGKNPTIILKSVDKQLIGQVAAKIRSFRKPEPYKGKGIKFINEQLRRKAGKAAGK
jgi:large subunit ribosomal protein L6